MLRIVVCVLLCVCVLFFFCQAEDGIRDLVRSRGLGDVYKRQFLNRAVDDGTLPSVSFQCPGRLMARLAARASNAAASDGACPARRLSLIHI